MNLKEQIEEYLQKNKFEIVSRTCDLVKIPSINDAANTYIKSHLFHHTMRTSGIFCCVRLQQHATPLISFRKTSRFSQTQMLQAPFGRDA